MGWDRKGRDRMGWDGMARKGKETEGKGRNLKKYLMYFDIVL